MPTEQWNRLFRKSLKDTMTKLHVYAQLQFIKNIFLFFKRRIKGIATFTYPARIASMNLRGRANSTFNFTGKVCYKILHDRSPLITVFCDKSAVRNYVESLIGKTYLPILYWEGITLCNHDLESLPDCLQLHTLANGVAMPLILKMSTQIICVDSLIIGRNRVFTIFRENYQSGAIRM